ncbi:MAG: methyltransferase domain-containing protein [Kiritimatiellota bacterium]|nr:methyltransferase domain-containing protein [Kiritimatiellota bacterium]
MSAGSDFSAKRVDYSAMDPYLFLAGWGKRVIHPGGRQSTEELLRSGDFHPGQRVLDVGCGVSTTAGLIVRQFGCQVTAVDISSEMLTLGRNTSSRLD